MSKCIALKAKRLVTPHSVVQDAVVVIKDGRIDGVGSQSTVPVPEDADVVDYGDDTLAPGLVDIHAHGYIKGRAGNSPELALSMAEFILRGGTTSFLPTVNRAHFAANVASARRIQKVQGYKGADIVGIHMEGPFLEPSNVAGVDTGDADRLEPDLDMLEEILYAGEGAIKIMGLGILLPNAEEVVRRLREEGIVVAVAHTKANAAQFSRAVEAGYQHATHLYNEMTGLHHRRPNVVGGFLTHDGTTCELICDALHVHPWAMDIAIRCKGPDRIAIITDLSLAGAEDGEYPRRPGSDIIIVVKDGIARFKGSNENQDHTMTGSTVLQNVGIRNVLKLGYSWPETFRMGSLTPARIIGLDRTKGSLEMTKDADIIVVDGDVNVKAVYVKGSLLYKA
jgi:N-acetylglucosamine-6-phosphate deacetylase